MRPNPLAFLTIVVLIGGLLVPTASAQTIRPAPIVASTVLGASGAEEATDIDVMPDGSVIVAGTTKSGVDFPSGDTNDFEAEDVFVARFSADLKQLLWSRTLGGSQEDLTSAVRIGSDGVYVVGTTYSPDFPTQGTIVFDRTYEGGSEGFVAKYGFNGNLVWSTYLGGRASEGVTDVDVDRDGKPVVVGYTNSCDFRATDGSLKGPPSDCMEPSDDAFVARFWPDGAMNRATLFGGSGTDVANALRVSPTTGSVVLTGITLSEDLPTTAGAMQRTANDAFVAKINADLTTLDFSTYIGGSFWENPLDVDRDEAGNVYVVGTTFSGDFPVSANAPQRSHARLEGCMDREGPGPCSDGFVMKINNAGTALMYGSYLGGIEDDFVASVDVDAAGLAQVGGASLSPSLGGSTDMGEDWQAFVATVAADGGSFPVLTPFGGDWYDRSYAVRWGGGRLWAVGQTGSSDFPTTEGAYDRSPDWADAFVTAFQVEAQGGGVTFDHRTGNEWWVEVDVHGATVSAVEARDTDGPWVALSKRSWGPWANSFHIEPGHQVQFRAFADGRWVDSCWFTHPAGVEQCAPPGFNPSFSGVKGNEWWIEAKVTAPQGVSSVSVSLNGGAPRPLDKTSWGTWAKSYHAPQGTIVRLIATAPDGSTAQSGCYRWVSAEPTSCTAAAPIVFDHKGGNEWWVEGIVTGGTASRFQAMDTGGAWTDLTLREWGHWAGSFRIEPGHTVKFRAQVGSDWYESCSFTHPAGAASTGGGTCVGTKVAP